MVNFIDRLHNGEIYISEEAKNIKYGPKNTGGFANIVYMMDHPPTSLASNLAESINQFDANPNFEVAGTCLIWINRAYAHGVIKEGTVTLTKLKEREQRIFDLENELAEVKSNSEKELIELREKHNQLSTDYVLLQGRYEELNEKLNRMLPDNGGI